MIFTTAAFDDVRQRLDEQNCDVRVLPKFSQCGYILRTWLCNKGHPPPPKKKKKEKNKNSIGYMMKVNCKKTYFDPNFNLTSNIKSHSSHLRQNLR